MNFTTIEILQSRVSASYGVVIQFNDKVFVSDLTFRGGYRADIYEFIETPEETGLDDVECRLSPWAKSKKTFEDNGHAIKWCFEQVRK